jgi:sulfoxide reductase heme-binding subunit YedZ
MNTFRKNWLRAILHIGAWLPLIVLGYDAINRRLGPEPIRESELRTGYVALVLLVLTLACTPLNTWFNFRFAIQHRRTLGLYAFAYSALHFLIFIGVDYLFDLSLLYEAVFEKPYALAGLVALLILIPLAITSTKGWQRRLGKRWRTLHYAVYLVAPIAVIHFIWSAKLDIRPPLAFGALAFALLAMRVPRLRHAIAQIRYRAKNIYARAPLAEDSSK